MGKLLSRSINLLPISFARRGRFRGASAPLSRLATTDASHHWRSGGGDRNRTDDLLLAKQALSQLSYTPSVLGEAQNPIPASAAPLRRGSPSFLRGNAAQKY